MLTDEQLVARAQAGDTAAMDAIVARYERAAIWASSDYYARGGERDDIRQEARLGLFYAIRDYRPERGVFQSFAFLCIRRQVITAVKTAGRGKHEVLTFASRVTVDEHGEQTGVIDVFPDPAGDASEILDGRAKIETIVRSIRRDLSPLERESIVGFAFLDETYAEIGATKRVDNALMRARRKLRAALAEADAVPLDLRRAA
jgi:RNA polymerase sporulation-specific sigma factor